MIHNFASFDNAMDETASLSLARAMLQYGERERPDFQSRDRLTEAQVAHARAYCRHGLTNRQSHIMLAAQFVGAIAKQFSKTTLTGDQNESKRY
jgi:hypothetical protein